MGRRATLAVPASFTVPESEPPRNSVTIGTSALTLLRKIEPDFWRYEYRTPIDAIVTKPRQHVQSEAGVFMPGGVNQSSLSAAVGVNIGASATLPRAMAHYGGSVSQLQAHAVSSFESTTGGATAGLFDTASLTFKFPWHSAPHMQASLSIGESSTALSSASQPASAEMPATTKLDPVATKGADFAPLSTVNTSATLNSVETRHWRRPLRIPDPISMPGPRAGARSI